jgi:hypothetical protein
MNKKTYYALCEALRRYTRFHPHEELVQAWTGLGYVTEYKSAIDSGHMEFVRTPMYRCLGWLHLTEKGAKVVREWLDAGYDYTSIESEVYPPMLKENNSQESTPTEENNAR